MKRSHSSPALMIREIVSYSLSKKDVRDGNTILQVGHKNIDLRNTLKLLREYASAAY